MSWSPEQLAEVLAKGKVKVAEGQSLTVFKGRDSGVVPPKPRKYGNVPTMVDGIRFDSKGEAARFCDLRYLEFTGQISNLEYDKKALRYRLEVGSVLICTWTADFRYSERGVVIVEDFKSGPTRTQQYRLKKKLLKAVYGIEIRETGR